MSSGYIIVTQMSDGSYALKANIRVLGGGFFGAKAGFWIGKVMTHFVVQVGIHVAAGVVTIVCPPAGPAAYMAMQGAAFVPTEIASNSIGLATGIYGAVITGPV